MINGRWRGRGHRDLRGYLGALAVLGVAAPIALSASAVPAHAAQPAFGHIATDLVYNADGDSAAVSVLSG
jgi:hypothetical protein